MFAQEDNRGHPDLNAAGVPLMTSLAIAPAIVSTIPFQALSTEEPIWLFVDVTLPSQSASLVSMAEPANSPASFTCLA